MSSLAAVERKSAAPLRALGPYTLGNVIGGGGMGVVYRAKHAETGEVVAVKTVRVPEERMVSSIRREIHALSRIRHAGIVRVLDQGYDAGLPWFAMELLQGRTLADELRRVWSGRFSQTFGTATITPSSLDMDWGSGENATGRTSFERALTQFPLSPMAVSGVFPAAGGQSEHRVPGGGETLVTGGGEPFQAGSAPALSVEEPLPNSTRSKAAAGQQERLLGTLLSIAETLAVLHSAGIVHRDLKTENIFMREDGTPILVDFGLAVPGALGREILRVGGGLEGTLPYTSPEQLLGEFVDARADLYSFGCVAYECLTGRPPFVSDSMSELVHLQLHRKPLPPSAWVSDISPEIDALVLSLLQKDPRKRIGYASDVCAALHQVIGSGRPSRPRAGAYSLYRAGFAGREAEIKSLERQRAKLREGCGGLHLLSGPSGIGKTRLLMEFMRWIRRDEVMVIAGQSSGLGFSDKPEFRIHASLLHPFREFFLALVDTYCDHGEEDIQRMFGDDLRVLAKFEPLLLTLPGVEKAPEPAELPSEATQQRVIESLKRLLLALSAEKPVLLVLDDVQWADELTLRFLSSLPDPVLSSKPVLIVAAFRDSDLQEELNTLIAKKDVPHTRLSNLGDTELASVIGDMLAAEVPNPALIARLQKLPASGNPFFISELLHVAWERGVLQRASSGNWEFRLDDDAPDNALPRDIAETSQSRLRGLNPNVRKVLEIASVWGRIIEPERLVGLEKLELAEIMDAIDELLVHGLVQAEQTGQIGFVHDGVYRAAYGQLSEDRRNALHLAIAERLERDQKDERTLPLLAHHYVEAGDTPKAFQYLVKNARNTLRSGAHKQAMALLKRAESISSEGGAGGFTPSRDERVMLALLMAEAAFGLGKADTAVEHASCVLDLYGRPKPRTTAGWVFALMKESSRQLTGLSQRYAKTIRSDEERMMYAHCSQALNWLNQSYVTLADPLRILSACFMMANAAEAAGELGKPAFAYSMIGATIGTVGMSKKAIQYFDRAHENAIQRGDIHGRVNVTVPEVSYCLGAALWDRIEERVHEIGPIAKSIGAKGEWEAIRMMFANYRLRSRGTEGVFDIVSEPIESAERRENPLSGAWAKAIAAQYLLMRGQYEESVQMADEIAPILRKGSGPAAGAMAVSIAACCELMLGRPDEARNKALQALKAFQGEMLMFMHEPGCRLVAEALLGLAAQTSRGGKRDAQDELKAAKAACKLLESMSRRYPLAQASSPRMWAKYYRIERRLSRAKRLLEMALHRSNHLKMLPEEAYARLEFVHHQRQGQASETFETHWGEAKRCLEQVGDVPALAELEALKHD